MSSEWRGGVRSERGSRGSALACVALLSACASAPKPAASPAGTATATRAASAPANDANTVPTPPGLIAVGRVRDYREWLRLQQTPALFDLLLGKLASDEPLANEWDPAQPIEFAVVFDRNFQRSAEAPEPKPSEEPASEEPADDSTAGPIAIPKSDSAFDHLLAAISIPLTRYAPETYEKLGFNHWSANAYERDSCLITPALGKAKARLVCSDHRDVTRQLYGYMTRGLPLQALSAAPIFAEFRPQQLKPLWESSRASLTTLLNALPNENSPTQHAAHDIALNLLDESDAWVASLESLRLEAGPSPTGEFRSTLRFTLRDPAPWLIQGYQATVTQITGAPAEFRALPADIGAAGYSYELPAERVLAMQSALVNLAKTALKEYGPLRPGADDEKLTPAQAQAVDRVTSDLIAALDSPCLRADHVVWATSSPTPTVAKQRAQPLNLVLQTNFGYYFVATPAAASCAGLGQSFIDTFELAQRSLPQKMRRDVPFTTSLRRRQALPELGAATIYRVTFSARSINSWLELDGKGAQKMPGFDRAMAAKAPLTLSMIVLPGANGGASDWFAIGLDEKALIAALARAVHPSAGRTLADSPELAPFLAKRPLSLSYQELTTPDEWLGGVLGKDAEVLAPIFALFRGTRITATTELVHVGNHSELSTNYHVSKEVLSALGTLLGWDLERYGTILQELDKK